MQNRPPIDPEHPWLAPLAGFSDLPFRLLCREYGAACAVTEMVSAKGLVYGERAGGKGADGTNDLLATTPADSPLVVQLFGAEPEFLREAVKILRDRGFLWFDLNMGCSVPKVTKTGAGAAMLKDPDNALRAAEAMIAEAGPGNAGFKLRLGWEAGSEVFWELGKNLAALGAGWLTLHPRFARQGFSGQADHTATGRLAAAVPIPVMASGDLISAEDGMKALEHGASGVMFARGAMGDPAIFQNFTELLRGGAVTAHSSESVRKLIERHAELAREFTPGKPGRKGFPPALLKMRTFVPRYVKNLHDARKLRLALASCDSWQGLEALLDDFFNPPTPENPKNPNRRSH